MIRFPSTDSMRPLRVIATVLIIAGLYVARDLLIPSALAVLLAFILHPVLARLRRWGVNRAFAVAITVTAAGLIAMGAGLVLTRQLLDLTDKLPDYRDNLRQKIREVRSSGGGKLSKIAGTIEDLKQELASTQPTTQASLVHPIGPILPVLPPLPVKVEVVDNSPDIGALASSVVAPLLEPIAGAAIVVVLLIFLLVHSDDVRERLIMFAGMRQISLSIAAVDEAGMRIARFLRMQVVVNAGYGTMVGVGLWLLGVPNAVLWGALGFLLRFIPYLGPWLAAILPTLLAFAVFPGWARPLSVIFTFAVIEFIVNMLLEPWLFGTSAGISSFGVVVASIFWAWIWGPVGLILAVPMTACLVVMGKHVPQLSFLHQMFSTEVTVPIVGRLYQRLLVGDERAAEQLVRGEWVGAGLPSVCDSLLLPTLAELKRDAAAGLITASQVRRALSIVEVICEVESPPGERPATMICLAAQNEIDDTAARLLVYCAADAGIAATLVSSHALANEAASEACRSAAAVVGIVQVTPVSVLHFRRLLKALAAQGCPRRSIVHLTAGLPPSANRAAAPASDAEVRQETSFASLIARLAELDSLPPMPAATTSAQHSLHQSAAR